MKFQYEIDVKQGLNTVAYVLGMKLPADTLTVAQLQEIPELEAKLEKLTGHRFHINQVG